jgi:hypothetical protein
LGVQAANVEKPWKFWRQQIEDCVACVWIASGRDKSGRFVQRNRHRPLTMNQLAIDFYVIALSWLRAEVCANAAIDRDATGRDHLIAFPA